MTKRKKDLRPIITAVTRTMYETGEEFDIELPDLAKTLIVVAGNVGFAAWNEGVIEELRNAADIFERQLLTGS